MSPLIAVFHKSTESNTKGRSETSATVTYFLISNANQLKDQCFLESNHSRLSYNSSVVVRQQYVTNKLLHHNCLNPHFVNEFPAVLPHNYSAWGTWWTLRHQINLGIFLNSQGYLKAIKLLACNQRGTSIPRLLQGKTGGCSTLVQLWHLPVSN